MKRDHRSHVCAFVVASWVVVAAVDAATGSQRQAGETQAASAPTVLFMCPHGAAKSVLASAYFQRAAKERGLSVRVISAGTEPDPEVSTAVATHLTKNGYDVPISKPRRATAEDMAAADVVISIGCDLKGLPAPRGKVLNWDDVPSTSEEFARADQKIREHVVQLIDELTRKQPR